MIHFLDFEASSLMKGSFPIEIAWVDQDGRGESHLIRPTDEWMTLNDGQPEWSAESERVHGIPLATLIAEGVDAAWVARRAEEVLGRLRRKPDYDRGQLVVTVPASQPRPGTAAGRGCSPGRRQSSLRA